MPGRLRRLRGLVTKKNQHCERDGNMKKFMNEFKEFALKGNIMSMAVGVITGVAFQGVVTSLTDNIISPLIGIFVRQNFDMLEVEIMGANLRYGAFITAVINFVILAFIVFLMVRSMNRLVESRKKEDNPTPASALAPACPYCKTILNADATRCHACTSMLEGYSQLIVEQVLR